MAKRLQLHWTSCAGHSVDLILEDIEKNIPKVKIALTKSMGINAYIHSSVALINMIRRFTAQKNLHRHVVTRSATSFITLYSIHKQKNNLRKMVTSQECKNSKRSKDSGERRWHPISCKIAIAKMFSIVLNWSALLLGFFKL